MAEYVVYDICQCPLLNVAMLIAVVMHCTPVRAQKPSSPAQANPYTHWIGTEFEVLPDMPGWNHEGGGLLADPVWYSLFERNGDYLVLLQWALPRKLDGKKPFRVTDMLLIPPIEKGLRLVLDCEPPRTNVTEKIFAVVRDVGRPDRLRDVRKAWKVDLDSGTISPVQTQGIVCSIPSG